MADITQVILERRTDGVPQAEDFRLESAPLPAPAEGQILIKVHYLSLDPYLRGKISGRHMSGGVEPGSVMAGETVGEVVESRSPDFAAGDTVHSFSGWCSYAAVDASTARKVRSHRLPLSLALGALGMPGLTAYAGVRRLADIRANDTFLISAASGAVGSVAGQIARLAGARTVGIVGSRRKSDWILSQARFDGAINYREEDLRDGIRRTCPDGVDVYFDAIGGDVLDAVCEQLALQARIILCGLLAQYNSKERLRGPPPGLIIRARAHMHGLVVYDHEDLRAEMEEKNSAWIHSGDMAYNEDVTDGLENAGEAFARLMSGRNFGKAIVRIG